MNVHEKSKFHPAPLCLPGYLALSQPVFRNPGLPDHESYVIHEYLDAKTGYITSKIEISLKERDGVKFYSMRCG